MTRKIDHITAKTVHYCDSCKYKVATAHCYGCKQDLCRDCSIRVHWDIFNDDDLGDHFIHFCVDCKKKYDIMAEKILPIHNQFNSKIEKLKDKFLKDCQDRKKLKHLKYD